MGPARPAIFGHADFRARRKTEKAAGALTSCQEDLPALRRRTRDLGVESSFGSGRSNFLPVCEVASKGSMLSPRGHRICEDVERFGSAWQVGTFGRAAGCKRGLAIAGGFRRRNREHGEPRHS